jgi:hypothetical protein
MRKGLIPALLVGFLLAGCGSSTPNKTDQLPPDADSSVPVPKDAVPQDAPIIPGDTGPNAGCDEDAVGTNYYILNCIPGGNGTPILRQLPTAVQNNCQP